MAQKGAKTKEQQELDSQMTVLFGQLTGIKKSRSDLDKIRMVEKVKFRNFLVRQFKTQEALFKSIRLLQAVYDGRTGKLLLSR